MSEEQKIQELMKPRYKVIAPYPHSPYNVGDMVETSINVPYPSFLCTETTSEDFDGKPCKCANWVQLPEISKYPHLFKPLQWWEEREESDMPQYLKHGTKGKPRKIQFYHLSIEKVVFDGGRERKLNDKWLPITSTEYNEYLSSKTKEG